MKNRRRKVKKWEFDKFFPLDIESGFCVEKTILMHIYP